jgi:hypothetical protein
MPGHPSDGLTLAEIQAAASEVGIDPALVERAARLLPATSPGSLFERVIGGPLRHDSEIHVSAKLDETKAAQLLAAVQIGAGQPGSGHSSSVGMVWHAKDEVEALRVTAQPEEGGTSIAVHIDRSGTLALVLVPSLIGCVAATAAAVALSATVDPALGAVAGVSGVSGIFALGRRYWASSTKQVRERISGLMDAIGQVIAQPEIPPSASSGDRGLSNG